MKVGDAVRCIADKFLFDNYTPNSYNKILLPKKNKVYTIRTVVKTDYGTGITLKEIRNNKIYHDQGGLKEPIFGINRFELVK